MTLQKSVGVVEEVEKALESVYSFAKRTDCA